MVASALALLARRRGASRPRTDLHHGLRGRGAAGSRARRYASRRTQPGQLQGKLSFTLDESGNLEKATLTLPNDTSLPVVGQATGNSLQMRIILDGREALVAMGVGEADIADCKGAVDGTTAGPQIGDLGDWHARAQGLTGQPAATAVADKKRRAVVAPR